MTESISIKTQEKHQLLDITRDVEEVLQKMKAKEGSLLVFARHTTCAVIISEVEDNLRDDIINYFLKEGPKGPFSHSHGNLFAHDTDYIGQPHTPAHILSAILGQSMVVPTTNGQMLLGTWQRICLLELDGPRERKIIIQFHQ